MDGALGIDKGEPGETNQPRRHSSHHRYLRGVGGHEAKKRRTGLGSTDDRPSLNSEGLAGNRCLQGRTEKHDAYSQFSRGDTEKLANRGRAKDAEEQRLNVGMFFNSGQGDLPRGGRVMRIIKNRQTCCALRLRIDPQQDLVRELIAGGCSGLPKGNVEDISIGVIGDARCLHGISPPVPKDLVSGDDKIVLGTARNKAETDNGDDRTVAGGQIFKVSVIEEHIGADRILKSPASSNRFQHLAFVAPHFRMLFADVVPAFIGQINLMAQLIFDRLQHRSGLIIKVNLLGLRVSHFSKLRWLGTFPCGRYFSREFERKQGIRRGAIEMMKLESRRNRESAGFPLRGHRARLCASFEAQS